MKKSKQILAALLTAALTTGVPAAALASEATDARASEYCQLNGSTLSILTHEDARHTANTAPRETLAFQHGGVSSLNTIIPTGTTLSPAKLDTTSMRFPTVVQTPDIALYSGDDIKAPSMVAPKLQSQPTGLYLDAGSMSLTSMQL